NTGLPPTPINSPSLTALEAALYPADTDYLYALKKPDGSLEFFSTHGDYSKAAEARKN
ncbi:MAG: endolytic transglycosylase MltG, partial [Bdellovibrionales bacterium]|nr:endolytic transglycosylase MltG [Bdellovibrionales bacterium]